MCIHQLVVFWLHKCKVLLLNNLALANAREVKVQNGEFVVSGQKTQYHLNLGSRNFILVYMARWLTWPNFIIGRLFMWLGPNNGQIRFFYGLHKWFGAMFKLTPIWPNFTFDQLFLWIGTNNDQIWLRRGQTSNSEQCLNRIQLDLILFLVNFSCELGPIMLMRNASQGSRPYCLVKIGISFGLYWNGMLYIGLQYLYHLAKCSVILWFWQTAAHRPFVKNIWQIIRKLWNKRITVAIHILFWCTHIFKCTQRIYIREYFNFGNLKLVMLLQIPQ